VDATGTDVKEVSKVRKSELDQEEMIKIAETSQEEKER